jgi:iron(III) transport system permease protein
MLISNPAQWLFLLTGATLAYLVLPPFFFILHTSLVVDRGLQAGAFTFQHFENIVASLGDVRTLLANSLTFSLGSAAMALVYGTVLAWLAERSDAPFRRLAYVSAYVSFAIPGIIKVVGWIMLLGPKAGMLNAPFAALTGSPLLNIFSMSGMVLVESFLWIPIVFLLMATPFRSMDPSLEEAAATAGSNGWQVFRRVTFPLAMPSAMASGASWFQMLRHVVVPLIMPALLAGWIYIFLITFKELSIALLLYSPGSQVVAVTIWELWDNGHVGELAAFSLVISVGTVILGSVFLSLAQRYGLQD